MSDKSNIIVDIGNTRMKSAQISGDKVSDLKNWTSLHDLGEYLDTDQRIFVGSVKEDHSQLRAILGARDNLAVFHRDMLLPISINYESKETLGLDRIAAAAGAHFLCPNTNVLSIDAGTCVTYDLIDSKGVFQGGIISPGLKMRLKAMHDYTANLPDLSDTWATHDSGLLGRSTNSCLVSGAKNGLLNEINATIDRFLDKYEDLKIILTGGDHAFFETNIKAPIFVRPNLVMIGLNQILINNEDF